MAAAREDAERLDLPEPARTVWRQAEKLIEAIRGGDTGNEVLVGGGTILACRWRHRGSTDVDLLVTGTDTLREWMEGGPADGAQLTGGRWDRPSEEHLRVLYELGSLDVTASRPRPEHGAGNGVVDGKGIKVLTTTQILRGKLNRAVQGRSPVRDLFDFATAAEKDPRALAEATGMLRRAEVEAITKTWGEQREEYAIRAQDELTTPGGNPILFPKVAKAAVQALDAHTTVRIRWRMDRGKTLTATRTLGDNRELTHVLKPEDAARAAEACGLTAYMAHNEGATARAILGEWERRRNRGETLELYDSRTAAQDTPEADRDPFAGLKTPGQQRLQKERKAGEQEIRERWQQNAKRKGPTAAEPGALPDRGSGHHPGGGRRGKERNGRTR